MGIRMRCTNGTAQLQHPYKMMKVFQTDSHAMYGQYHPAAKPPRKGLRV
jgi:hypothetical protein